MAGVSSLFDGLLNRDTDEEVTGSRVDFQTAVEAVGSRRRRHAIRRLVEAESDVCDLSDITDKMTSDEFGTTHSSQERKRIYVGLYQSHIPRLEKDDLVTVLDDRTTICVSPALYDVYEWMQDSRDRFGGGV